MIIPISSKFSKFGQNNAREYECLIFFNQENERTSCFSALQLSPILSLTTFAHTFLLSFKKSGEFGIHMAHPKSPLFCKKIIPAARGWGMRRVRTGELRLALGRHPLAVGHIPYHSFIAMFTKSGTRRPSHFNSCKWTHSPEYVTPQAARNIPVGTSNRPGIAVHLWLDLVTTM